MTASEIDRLSPQERLDLIGALCDSLLADHVSLTPAQSAELSGRVGALDYANDDLSWAKPLIDEALAEVERGEVVSLEAHEARMDALMARLTAK